VVVAFNRSKYGFDIFARTSDERSASCDADAVSYEEHSIVASEIVQIDGVLERARYETHESAISCGDH
jgi:hypothetical protein